MKKNIIILLLILGTGWHSYAQGRERIKAYKTGYITEQLDLDSKEAEKFWPIYNNYEKQIFSIKILKVRENRKKINEKGGIDALSDQEAVAYLDNFLQNEKEITKLREDQYTDLSTVLSPVKLLKLYKAEADFSKKLLSDYRKRKGKDQ